MEIKEKMWLSAHAANGQVYYYASPYLVEGNGFIPLVGPVEVAFEVPKTENEIRQLLGLAVDEKIKEVQAKAHKEVNDLIAEKNKLLAIEAPKEDLYPSGVKKTSMASISDPDLDDDIPF